MSSLPSAQFRHVQHTGALLLPGDVLSQPVSKVNNSVSNGLCHTMDVSATHSVFCTHAFDVGTYPFDFGTNSFDLGTHICSILDIYV